MFLFWGRVGVMLVVGLRGYIFGWIDVMVNIKKIKCCFIMIDIMNFEVFFGSNFFMFIFCKFFKSLFVFFYDFFLKLDWLWEVEREVFLFNFIWMEVVERFDYRDCDDCLGDGLIGFGYIGW